MRHYDPYFTQMGQHKEKKKKKKEHHHHHQQQYINQIVLNLEDQLYLNASYKISKETLLSEQAKQFSPTGF